MQLMKQVLNVTVPKVIFIKGLAVRVYKFMGLTLYFPIIVKSLMVASCYLLSFRETKAYCIKVVTFNAQ